MSLPYVGVQTFGGGMDLGLTQAGFELIGRREQLGGFGLAQCEANRHLLGDAWEGQASLPAEWEVPNEELPLVASLPPCSGFSMMSVRAGSAESRRDWRGVDAPINSCMWATVEFAARVNGGEGPPIVVFESVQGAGRDSDKGGLSLMRQLHAHLEDLTGHEYTLNNVFHNAASVGGASIRRRYFWLCSRIPFGIETPQIARVPTMRDSIGDLDVDVETWEPQPYATPENWWTRGLSLIDDPSTRAASSRRNADGLVNGNQVWHREQNHLGRVAGVLEIGWRNGEQMTDALKRYHEATGLWPPNWDEKAQATVIRTNFQGGAYQPARWYENRAGRVLAGNAMSNVVHPWLDRTLTHREVARIMGFPDSWNLETYTAGGANAVYGKAVTVDCGRWIGYWIKRALEGDPGKWDGVSTGERERTYNITNDYKRVYNDRTGEHGDFRSQTTRKEMEARPA